MKILISSDLYRPAVNGVVTSVSNLERELRRRGHEVRILTLSPDRRSFQEDSVYRAGSFSAARIYPQTRFSFCPPLAFMDEILAWRPDVVHSQCEFSTFRWAARISSLLDIPLIHTFHTVYEDYTHYFPLIERPLRAMVPFVMRRLLNRCDRVIAPTEKIRRKLADYGVSREIRVSPSGISLDRFGTARATERSRKIRASLRIGQEQKMLLFLGRLAQEKNVEELLEFRRKAKDPSWVLVIAGGGPHEGVLRETARRLGLAGDVRFTGMVPPEDTPEYFAAADAFVCASTSETQGLTYIEALASGLPLLCRADPCLEGVLEQGINGCRFRDFQEFRRGMRTIFQFPDRYRLMCQAARKTARKFSSASFAKRTEEIYMEARAERQPQPIPHKIPVSCRLRTGAR